MNIFGRLRRRYFHSDQRRSCLQACPSSCEAASRPVFRWTPLYPACPPTTRDSTFAYLDGKRLSPPISSIWLALYKNPARPVPLHHPPHRPLPLTYNPDGHGQPHARTHSLYFQFSQKITSPVETGRVRLPHVCGMVADYI